VGISGSPKSFIDGYSFFFVSRTDVVFLTRGDFPSATNNVRPAPGGTSGPLQEERQQRRVVYTVWRLKTKGISKISM
jgi:hypothetical protein